MMKGKQSFACQQLEKHGWVEGKGLGKNEVGIKAPIKVAFKNDTVGLGVDRAEEFTFHWWDHVFNKTAKNIKVSTNKDDDVFLSKSSETSDVDIVTKKSQKKLKSKKDATLLYGRFMKASTLSGGEEVRTSVADCSTDDESEGEQSHASYSVLDEVYKLTGLTGHKAARHGHRLSGKLQRVSEHEDKDAERKKRKLEKHYAHNCLDPSNEVDLNVSQEKTLSNLDVTEDESSENTTKGQDAATLIGLDDRISPIKEKKRKKKKRKKDKN